MTKPNGEMVSLSRTDGKPFKGYLARPERSEGAPAIVVIQEWWGLNDQIRREADRLADCGYLALVPDLYHGKSAVVEEEAHHLMQGLDFGSAVAQEIRGAVDYLRAHASKVGIVGFCMGGALTMLSACAIPELDAAVVFYGTPPLDYVDAAKIKMPLLGHWATQDAFFPIDTVDALEAKLRSVGANFEFHRYLAHHAFANETAIGEGRIAGTQYDPRWAQLAWDRTLTFFGRTLWA